MTSIELTSSTLRELILPVMPLASDDLTFPVLAAVLIRSDGTTVTALATDRYRAGIQRITPAQAAEGFSALVSTTDLRHILTVFKPARKMDTELRLTTGEDAGKPTITIEAIGGLTTFSAASFTYRQVDDAYPLIDSLFAQALERVPTRPVPDFAVDPRFLADFKPLRRGEPMRVSVSDALKPILITIGNDFLGLLMPVKRSAEDSETFGATWRATFPAEPVEKAS